MSTLQDRLHGLGLQLSEAISDAKLEIATLTAAAPKKNTIQSPACLLTLSSLGFSLPSTRVRFRLSVSLSLRLLLHMICDLYDSL